jgi:hypothetical protein
LLIFILIMFYIMYQYFDMYEINMAEIARQQYDLDQANADLNEKTEKLSEAEEKMLAQQIHVQGLRGLQIGVAAAGGREIGVVLGAVVIIQADHVGEDAPPLQGGADAACGRGLAGGGGSCQQDDLAPVQAGEDDVRRLLHAALIERVALGHVARRVRGQGAVDFR